ncbi:type 3 dihydrofolate reductase [Salmonella enterica]|nr:type 3 dihydrofolate reductase [Salmonella enterica]EAY4638097.1 type 3 dihydrofolate reductase [Salmonella enterica]
MLISLIVATAQNRVIGKGNAMPWHLPADLRHFKNITLGKPVVMGRRTFESIGRPLPGRRNLVISRNPEWQADGVEVAASLDDALALVSGVDEVMILGGGQLYAEALPRADRLYLTLIDLTVEGDTYFPDYQRYSWQELERSTHQPDEKNPHAYTFVTLERS